MQAHLGVSLRNICRVWARFAIVLAACLCQVSINLTAQTHQLCSGQSSFQFPLWNDTLQWLGADGTSSVRLADIDGDGQVELIGVSTRGVEIWHWEPKGQAWIPMHAATPPWTGLDYFMTADVDGDGQAELIQFTVPVNEATIHVWHYDASPGVWRRMPGLDMKVPGVVTGLGPNNVNEPFFRFADLAGTGQQELVFLTGLVRNGGLFATPSVYQAAKDGSGWKRRNTGGETAISSAYLNNNFDFANLGNGLRQLVFLGQGGFIFIRQAATPTQDQIRFASGFAKSLPGSKIVPPFVPVDFDGNGHDQIAFIRENGDLDVTLTADSGDPNAILTTANLDSQVKSQPMQALYTSLGKTPASKDLLLIGANGLNEYGTPQSGGKAAKIANSPFISKKRFGDALFHSTSIQTGKVQDALGQPQTILVARDATGLRTLVPSQNVCQSGTRGFTLVQGGYFPTFLGGQAAAYSAISNLLVRGNNDIRSIYSSNFASLASYQASLLHVKYPAGSTKFTEQDFDNTKAQLNKEFLAAANAGQFFESTRTQIEDLFDAEAAAVPGILTALSLPSDASADNSAGAIFGNILLSVVNAIFSFAGSSDTNAGKFGLASVDEAYAINGSMSVLTTIINDVVSATSSSGGGDLAGQTLVVEDQLETWRAMAATQTASASAATFRNWDLMETVSQQIGVGAVTATSRIQEKAVEAGLKKFQLATWQALAPQVWYIYGDFNGADSHLARELSGYSYYIRQDGTPPALSCCATSVKWLVWAALSSAKPAHGAVATSTINELSKLGVDWHDILARRNGWENIPFDDSMGYRGNVTIALSQPAPPKPPRIGPPSRMVVTGGVGSPRTYACGGSTLPILEQSTPVFSVIPKPIKIRVTDSNGNGVPAATVRFKGRTSMGNNGVDFTTDSRGFATVTLVAEEKAETGPINTNIAPNYFTINGTTDPQAPSCMIHIPYILRTMLSPVDNTAQRAGVNAQVDRTPRNNPPAGNARTLTIRWRTHGLPVSTLKGITFVQKGSPGCALPQLTSSLPIPTTPSADGNSFTTIANLTLPDYTQCGNRSPIYGITVTVTSNVMSDDGSIYAAPITAVLTTDLN
jgi:hypothetical protein